MKGTGIFPGRLLICRMKFFFLILFGGFCNLVSAQISSQVNPSKSPAPYFPSILPFRAGPVLLIPPINSQKNESVVLSRPNQVNTNMDHSPFFCRIEEAIARSSKINLKFRLGSVQYVDALEGKGYFEALSYSKATNFQMTRKN
jgi:hypothetical protein